MPWITPFGAFWKPKPVLKLTKPVESLKRALIKAWDEEIPLETLRKVIMISRSD
jgi:hypothetical protein